MDNSKPIPLRSAQLHRPKYTKARVYRMSQEAGASSGSSIRTRQRLPLSHGVRRARKPEVFFKNLDRVDKIVDLGISGYRPILKYDDDLGYDGDVEPDTETGRQRWKRLLIIALTQMMFVSGETAEPSPETTGMIEEIVRQQVVEMVSPIITGYVRLEWI